MMKMTKKLYNRQKELLEKHNILVIVDYDYEFTNKSYYYKIYVLGEHGKPERVEVKSERYDKDGKTIVTTHYRDYKHSYKDYATYDEALEDGIKEATSMIPEETPTEEKPVEKLIKCRMGIPGIDCWGNTMDDCMYCDAYTKFLREKNEKKN